MKLVKRLVLFRGIHNPGGSVFHMSQSMGIEWFGCEGIMKLRTVSATKCCMIIYASQTQ